VVAHAGGEIAFGPADVDFRHGDAGHHAALHGHDLPAGDGHVLVGGDGEVVSPAAVALNVLGLADRHDCRGGDRAQRRVLRQSVGFADGDGGEAVGVHAAAEVAVLV